MTHGRPEPTTLEQPLGGLRGHYRVFVRDLMLPFPVGVHDHEKGRPQRVRFNVDLLVGDPSRPMEDKLRNTVSYEGIAKRIQDLSEDGHINLLETLAERVADLCLADERVVLVRVRVEKLDIEPSAASVGVEIERHRESADGGSVVHLAAVAEAE